MRLVIGGYGQGKLEFVLGGLDVSEYGVWDGELPGDGKWNGFPVVNHFHRWVRGRLMDGGCPVMRWRMAKDKMRKCPAGECLTVKA